MEGFIKNTHLFEDEGTYFNNIFEEDDYSFLNVKNCDFKNCILKNMIITDTTFDHCYFTDVLFDNCDFSNTKFDETLIKKCTFKNCKTLGMQINDSILDHTTFESCMMSYTSFYHSQIKEVVYQSSKLNESFFTNCHLKAYFHETELTMAEIDHTSFKGIDLSSAILTGIRMTPFDLKGAIISADQAVDLIPLLGVILK